MAIVNGVLAPPAVVSPPQAVLPNSGLLTAFPPVVDPADVRWESGFLFLPEACDAGDVEGTCGPIVRSDHTTPDVVEVQPYLIEATYTCTTRGFAENQYTERAQRQLEVEQQKLMETELWRGNVAIAEGWGNPYLTNPATVTEIAAGAAQPIYWGFVQLQQALAAASPGGRGVIHMPWSVASFLGSNFMVYRTGTILHDLMGNVVVAGEGYDGSAPSSTNPVVPGASRWVYATGEVVTRLGDSMMIPDNLNEATDRRTNTVAYYAQRMAAAVFDQCVHIGVNLTLPTSA